MINGRRLRWLLFVPALIGFVYIGFKNCDCLPGRRSVLHVHELPVGCRILHTPEPWRGSDQTQFKPDWVEPGMSPPSRANYQYRSRFEVRQRKGAYLFKLINVKSGVRKESENAFQLQGSQLKFASSADWQDSSQLPASRHIYNYIKNRDPDKFKGTDLTGLAAASSGDIAMTMSHTGPLFEPVGAGDLYYSLDWIVPWKVQRPVFIDFTRYTRPGVVFGTVQFSMCGPEFWMRDSVLFNGATFFTMPLSKDGRVILACDFSLNSLPNSIEK